MSKAFTREDADASFDAPPPAVRLSDARLTAYGARLARERLHELESTRSAGDDALSTERLRGLLAHAAVIEPARAEHVALGARVTTRSRSGAERTAVVVTPDEVGIVPSAVSVASPLARALLGAQVGDTVELELPGRLDELTITAIEWPS